MHGRGVGRPAWPMVGARLLLAVAPIGAGMAWAATPSLDDLLRRADYDEIGLSPRGDHLATRVSFDDRTVLVIQRRADGGNTAILDPGKDSYIDAFAWVGDERVFAAWSRRLGTVAEPYSMWSLQSIDVDGGNRRAFHGRVIDPLVHDQERVLVVECTKVVRNECLTRLREAPTKGSGRRRDIVDGPVPDATFITDRTGRPVMAWATDNDDVQRAFLRRDDTWVLVNDEAESGVEVVPVGASHDLRHGYLWSERHEGPDVIESIELATGRRSIVASDPVLSPSSLVLSFDRSEVIGVRYGRQAPKLRFFDESHPHARLYRELEKEFPSELAVVTSATRDGRLALVRVTGDREPGRAYLLDVASGELSLLLRSRPWLDREALASQEAVSIRAGDGLELHGYLTRPRATTATGAPLVVLVHGGPFGVTDVWGFDEEVQMLAARGYAVLQVNFRGSGGRGRAFMESGYRQWGGLMQDDVTIATRWAQSQPGIADRACIWGASYGGYAAVMATVREPRLYRCAIGTAGPYDLPTLYKWGDLQRSRWGKGRLQRTLGEDQKVLLENSPTRHADRIEAALLVVQGARDGRVSPEHVRALRKALDAAGKRYETYLPRNETHGFFAEAARREYYRRVFDFLGRHLPATAADAPGRQP